MLLRILIFTAIAVMVYLGVRRIWRDWTRKFDGDAEEAKRLRRQRDLAERKRPDIIDLKRDEDGTFRPNGRDDDKRG